MQIVFDEGGRLRELDVEVNNPTATVADLAAALDPGLGDDRPLQIGDHTPDPDLDIREAGLHEGAIVRFATTESQLRRPAGAATGGDGTVATSRTALTADNATELVVTNGLDAGRRFLLPPGTAVLGRASECQLTVRHETVSRQHASIEVAPGGELTVTDLESHNGTWIDDEPVVGSCALPQGVRLRLGALELQVRGAQRHDRPMTVDPQRHVGVGGTIPFNRPPRQAPPPSTQSVRAPKPPRTTTGGSTGSLMMMIGPVAMGGVALLIGRPEYAFVALISPIVAIGRYIEGRSRGRQNRKKERKRFRKELPEFEQKLADAAQHEHGRLEASYPDAAEIVRRVSLPSTSLWERRPDDPDFLRLRAGVGTVPWNPPVTNFKPDDETPEMLLAAVDKASRLAGAPTAVDLSGHGVVGIVGDRSAALALARSLVCQATILHGPADLPVTVLAAEDAAPAWDWAKWLPHTRSSTGSTRMLSSTTDLSTQMTEGRLQAARALRSKDRSVGAVGATAETGNAAGPTLLLVVDDEALLRGRKAPTRNLLRGEAGAVAGIVVASTADRLPATCTTIVEMTGPDGEARLTRPQAGGPITDFMASGFSDDVARDCARSLARYEDPELEIVGAGLPSTVRLLPLLDLEECTPERVLARWKAGGTDPPPAAPVGVTEDDVFTLDFTTDGPHGLVGGTTGAGKSELLRAMVASLAASVDPDHLTFVLVDFKGGSAFDECAKLPHTVGMVTDLDEHLAERALRCLEAELKYRERLLRDAAAVDLPDYIRNNKGDEPLPRMLVIIDEFATLKAELPEFIDALVGVAQRGRSLGVHMLLATQRPQGAINDNIKANTNMRIALRMQDATDSKDVIGVPDAADLPRDKPGRMYARLGPGEIVAIQSAYSTGDWNEAAMAAIDLAPFVYGPLSRRSAPAPSTPAPPEASLTEGAEVDDETDLSMLVKAINAAFAQTDSPLPRRPWPDELPLEQDLEELLDQAMAATAESPSANGRRPATVPVALADDPDNQTQYPVGWTPSEGNLLIYGLVGSGTTTLLGSLALSIARLYSAEELHLYVVDMGAGELLPLADLPHCGAVIQAHERERQQRVMRLLRRELDRRRGLSAAERAELPMLVAMIDGWPAFRDEYDDVAGRDMLDSFVRVCADGAEVKIYLMLSADRAAGIGSKLAATARQRWAFRLADKSDYQQTVQMSRRAVPNMVPGHALVSERQQLVHVGRPADGLAAAVDRLRAAASRPSPERSPEPIESLPDQVPFADVAARAQLDSRPWIVPIGIAERDLGPAALVAYEGEHALVAGPARTGKSTTLQTIARAVLAARPDAHVVAVADRRSPLATDPCVQEHISPADAPTRLPEVLGTDAPLLLVLVDDADRIDDRKLEDFGTGKHDNALIVAAGRPETLKGTRHWTKGLRTAKLGVVIKPDADTGGDAVGAKLPRRHAVPMINGRGYIVNNGEPTLVQIALPDDQAG